MGERRGTKALELWCRRMTQGYPGVAVNNMTTSWRDGLAFCAMIHHFRPDLIDFTKLNKDDIYYNNELAFQTAEQHLGIPALLEPEDMVEHPIPDRLSILTYLSQYYQAFVTAEGSPSRLVSKRPLNSEERGLVTPLPKSSSTKAVRTTAGKIRREPCGKCGLPVFIAERLNVGKNLFHRTCFRCSRCNSQLTLANYYETEIENQFCCETCPDEEKIKMEVHKSILLNRSMSDDEKSADLHKVDDEDNYSSVFETSLENFESKSDTLNSRTSLILDKYRTNFATIQNFVKNEDYSSGEESLPELPQSLPPQKLEFATDSKTFSENSGSLCCDSGFPSNNQHLDLIVNSNVELSDFSDKNQSKTAIEQLDEVNNKFFTKENTPPSENQSLVKSRTSFFENEIETNQDTPSVICFDETVSEAESPRISIVEISSDVNTTQEYKIDDDDSVIIISDESDCVIVEDNLGSEALPQVENRQVPKIIEETVLPNTESYPDDLNPFDDEDEDEPKVAPTPLNPFDEDDEKVDSYTPIPAVRKKLKLRKEDFNLSESLIEHGSINPFEDDVEVSKRHIEAPKISLNPFWSDGEEPDDDDGSLTGVSEPKSDRLHPSLASTAIFGSNASLSSSYSNVDTMKGKKKKQAPKPPTDKIDSSHSSLTSSPSPSVQHSPKSTPKLRKARRAPLPPTCTSTPLTTENDAALAENTQNLSSILETSRPVEKDIKNEVNRNRQSGADESLSKSLIVNKSIQGQWKRRKGRAPSLPIPQRRNIKPLPLQEIKQELEVIEIQQQGLEKQGVRLEEIIRSKCEGTAANAEAPLEPDVEDLILQLFELVNEKNQLFRKQAELMYLRRQQRLEEEHADVEYQIRCLMNISESVKTDLHKAKEEELISQLIDVVERRNEIVNCLDMDRLRENEEDSSITNQLNLYTLKRGECSAIPSATPEKKKSKKFKLKISKKADIDKDIDESESSKSPVKIKKKKKFNIF